MVHASAAAAPSAVISPSPATSVAISAASDASIAAYLRAGERMRVLSGWVAIALLAFMLVFIIAMVVGLIPVRLS